MQEEWKQSIVANYEVSTHGRVRNIETKHILALEKEEKGYCRLSVVIDGKKKHYPVHRLVAKAFIPNPYNYPQVDHIDSDKTNNHISNLRWCTNKQNSQWRTERRRKEEQWKN